MKNLTKKHLKALSGNTIYNRGKKYYETGAVKEINLKKGKYIANVLGTEKYLVSYNPKNHQFDCNCPYDDFCKHCVAFGLKLIDELSDFKDGQQTFTDFANSTDDKIKLKFLNKLFTENSKLQEEFIKFHKFETNQFEDVKVEDIAEEIYDKLAFFDHEDIYDRETSGYYQEPYELAGEIIEDEMIDFQDEIKEYLKKNSIENALKYYLGTTLGLLKSEETVLGEYTGETINYNYEIENLFIKTLKKQNIEVKKQILTIFFREIKKEKELQNWYLFNSFFEIYLKDKEFGILIKEKISKFPQNIFYTTDIIRRIEKLLGNTDNIKKLAEKNPDDKKLSIDYLRILFKEKDFEKANKIIEKYVIKNRYPKEIEEFIVPELGENKYKFFLEICISECNSFEAYKKLREFIDDKQAKKIRDSLSSDDFIHKINVFEKWHEDILAFIEKNAKNYFFSYETYIKDIEKIYPEKSFKIHTNYIDKLMNSSDRNRDSYKEIVKIIKRLQKIDSVKTKQIINKLYNRVPQLPALKDEFMKAKLV